MPGRHVDFYLLSDAKYTCKRRPEVRFEVLVREGMVQQAVGLIEEIVKPQNTASFQVLRDCFNVLGSEFFSQNSAVLDALWPLLQETVQQTPEIDVAMEVLVIATPQRALSLYDCNLETCQQQCQQHAVNAAAKANLRNWLIRTKRMYLAANQNIEWERRLKDISSSLKRKSSVSSIFAEVAEPGQIMSPGTPGMTERSSSRPAKSSRRCVDIARPRALPFACCAPFYPDLVLLFPLCAATAASLHRLCPSRCHRRRCQLHRCRQLLHISERNTN